jgi:CDP-diacylglycerol--serine O-phosphatidyltransferase
MSMQDEQPTADQSAPPKRRRGIYLLPNMLTTAALFAGFYAIVAAMQDRFDTAAIAIFVAMVLDGLDGRVARLTQTQSDFGGEYDSLSDMVSFGLAPALVVYAWALESLGKSGWLAAFVFTAGAALRLARFNVQKGVVDKRYFQGLASPSAAALVAGLVWVGVDLGIPGEDLRLVAFAITVTAGLLMVSNFRYRSFKDVDVKGRMPFMMAVAVMLVFTIVFIQPPLVLFTLASVYTLSGIVVTLIELQRRRRERHGGDRPGP